MPGAVNFHNADIGCKNVSNLVIYCSGNIKKEICTITEYTRQGGDSDVLPDCYNIIIILAFIVRIKGIGCTVVKRKIKIDIVLIVNLPDDPAGRIKYKKRGCSPRLRFKRQILL
jgi:hypothetical protein